MFNAHHPFFRCGSPVKTTKHRLAVLIALGISSVSSVAYAENTLVVNAESAEPQENAWGPAATIAAKHSATATKTDTPIEKTPQSISVVTNEEMQTHQFQSVKEALGYTPGVTVASRGASNTYDAVLIRGFGSVNQNNYLDGLKLQGDFFNEAVVDPYMLERVELMRGPTSVLYGKSSPGGIISMVSKRPTQEPLREVQFKMGSDNLFQTGFDFGGPLDDNGEYSYRLTGLARDADEQQNFSDSKRFALAPSFSWRPDDKTNLTLLANIQNEPSLGYYGWLPRSGTVDPLPNGSRLSPKFNEGATNNMYARQQRMVGYSFEHALDDTFTVRQNLRYMQLRTDQNSVYGTDICTAATGSCAGIAPGDLNHYLSRGTIVSREKLNSFAVDTQLESKFTTGSVSHTLLTGVDYQRTRNDVSALFGSAPALDLYNPVFNDFDFASAPGYQLNRQEQVGLYAQEQGEWNKWVLTVGGRYDWLKQSTLTRSTNTSTDRKDGQFTSRAGLNYLFDNGVSPYISYSESFEPNSGADFGGSTFAPSKGRQYEAGVKYVPKDRPIVVTGALYQLTKTNNLTADPSHAFFNIASGEIRSRGVELEAKAALNANINMTASYTYTDAKYTKDTTLQDKQPVQVPRNMASLWGDYTFHSGPVSGLTLGTGARYLGASYGDPDNTFKAGSATLADAVVKYDLGRFGLDGSSIALNINNLFDRHYVSSCFAQQGCFWGAERQIVGTATFRF
ncbi:Ferric hydroxamate outer membrane receptor FhuA [Paramixta manurensis]|uniref:Ferric hydroxamate outer membrane receptor FhuA n=1 Tax=Paramixta manurensis TaxID=2740817 RepID=A0A6M8U8C1_9GAMM|nr:Ferric hydroxamate outer membrane receptor FhuA [Erwiniaceae bacterium PD-1]